MDISIGRTAPELAEITKLASETPLTPELSAFIAAAERDGFNAALLKEGSNTATVEPNSATNFELNSPARFNTNRDFTSLALAGIFRVRRAVRPRSILEQTNSTLTTEQQSLALTESQCRDAINRSARQAVNLFSYGTSILAGEISSKSELRVRTEPSIVDKLNGETQKVSTEQAETLQAVYEQAAATRTYEATLADTRSYYANINTCRPSPTDIGELDACLRAAGGYARTERGGRFLTLNGDLIEEDRSVEPAQAALLREDLAAVLEVKQAALQARDYNSLLEAALNIGGSFPRQVIEKRLLSEKGLSPAQAIKILRTYDQVQQLGAYEDELRDEINKGGTGEITISTINRDITNGSTENGSPERQALIDSFNTVTQIAREVRRARADEEILQQIVSTEGDERTVLRLISDDPEDDGIDRERHRRLAELCYQTRRARISGGIYEKLTTGVETDEILQDITQLATQSTDLRDTERAAALTREVYKAELLRSEQTLAESIFTNAAFDTGYYDLKEQPLRPDVAGFNYAQQLDERNTRLAQLETTSRQALVELSIKAAVDSFANESAQFVFEAINEIAANPDAADAGEALLELYKLYVTNRRNERPEDFKEVFTFKIGALQTAIEQTYNFDQGLGKNFAAAAFLAGNFKDVILPLYNSLRADPAFRDIINEYHSRAARNRFMQDPAVIGEQRELSQIETDYLESVKMLSSFNSCLVAVAAANPSLAHAYLEAHFAQLSRNTAETLFGRSSFAYSPVLQIGTGPNSITALAEVIRSRPDLADKIVVVDNGTVPGGPFSLPNGAAWKLNSANGVGTSEGVTITEASPPELAGKRVRDYGSSLRFYPGERVNGSDTRPGSINTTADYLTTPDQSSKTRYATNEELSVQLQLQAAMLSNKMLTRTNVVSVKPVTDGTDAKYLAILEIISPEGKTSYTGLYTDAVIAGSGLGKPAYGFDLNNSRAIAVLTAQNSTQEFPALTTTLPAFKRLADRRETAAPSALGPVVALYGSGDSVATLIENIAGLFDGDNAAGRNVKKIYVITTGDLSDRFRYAAIKDVLKRNGRDEENLVEEIDARVGDVGFASNQGKDALLKIYDANDVVLKNSQGEEILANHVISGAGFTPDIANIFEQIPGATEQTPNGARLLTDSVTLPTNPTVLVGETVLGHPDILLVGTGARSGFDNPDKLDQLPLLSKNALLRNGAENAVAIGFRTADSQAATRLFLENNAMLGRRKTVPFFTEPPQKVRRTVLDGSAITPAGMIIAAGEIPEKLPATRRDVPADAATLSSLVNRHFAAIKLKNVPRESEYVVRYNVNGTLSTTSAIPTALNPHLLAAVKDPHFVSYAQKAVKNRRASAVEIRLTFTNGRLSAESYSQAL